MVRVDAKETFPTSSLHQQTATFVPNGQFILPAPASGYVGYTVD